MAKTIKTQSFVDSKITQKRYKSNEIFIKIIKKPIIFANINPKTEIDDFYFQDFCVPKCECQNSLILLLLLLI